MLEQKKIKGCGELFRVLRTRLRYRLKTGCSPAVINNSVNIEIIIKKNRKVSY